MRRAERALTLLEVLAAVALLGLLYTVLARTAVQGLRAEGESKRRIEASLLLDAELVTIETQLAAGVAPPLGFNETEAEAGDFRIGTNVRPLEFYEELAGNLEAAPTDAPSVLGRQGQGGESPLRVISIAVSWNEGVFERRLERTTFGLDREAASSALASLERGSTTRRTRR